MADLLRDPVANAAASRLYRETQRTIVDRLGRRRIEAVPLADLLASAYMLGALDAAEVSARAHAPQLPEGL